MAISFSGLVSGLDTSSWVEALVSAKKQDVTKLQTELTKQQNVKSVLNDTRSSVSSLRSALEKFTDAKFGGTFDLFAQNSAESSNTEIFTATVSSNARRQNYDVSVQQLATFTKATSRQAASSAADDDTELSKLGIKEGSITAYVNGHKHTIEIGEEDTVGDLKSNFAAAGITMNIDSNGVVKFSAANDSDNIHIGTTTDTANFTSLIGLERLEDGTYTSNNSLYKASTSSKLTDADSGFNETIKEGTFTIGNATFTIDDKTTLSSLISKINSTEEAQAYAYWDDTTGKLSITSTKEGASYINIEAGTSNFTDVMGLTSSTWDGEGNLTSSEMLIDTQELGKNAIFTVNGTSITSSSNTVTSDISRIDGVTLTLKRANTEEDEKTTLNVSQDTTKLKDAVKNFVTSYNAFVEKIDTVTANGAELHGESSLTSLENTIRSYASSANTTNGGVFKLLADIGITTTAADSNNLSADTKSLTFDEEKFTKAMEENPDSVKAILAGDNGVFAMMEDSVEQSLKSLTGFFDVKTSTIDSNIKKTTDKISRKNTSITSYKAQLEKKFKAMETMIAKMQQNYQSFLS